MNNQLDDLQIFNHQKKKKEKKIANNTDTFQLILPINNNKYGDETEPFSSL